MIAYPKNNKISFYWLTIALEDLVNPMQELELSGIAAKVLHHLRHLSLVRDDRIEWGANDQEDTI